MSALRKIPNIPDEQITPLVAELLEIIQLQGEEIQHLNDEIARLKGQKPKPKIKPSKLEKKNKKPKKQKPNKTEQPITKELEIDEVINIPPNNIPPGSVLKDYQDWHVQDLIISNWNICYRRERWETPDGEFIIGELPKEIEHSHFGPTLTAFVLYQHYNCHVTQPLIAEQLREYGVDISAGKISDILINNKDLYHREKDQILEIGLKLSGHVNVDDTGARHKGQNGYCTHIGNEFFTWFESTESKSRVNFLKLLQCDQSDLILSEDALEYMAAHGLPLFQLDKLIDNGPQFFESEMAWDAFLDAKGITTSNHRRIATEGALVGSLVYHGYNTQMAIISDDAGQFNIFLHGLCWVHAERTIRKIIGYTDLHRSFLEEAQNSIWAFYKDLKAYQLNPCEADKAKLEARFDELFSQVTGFESLDQAMKRIHANKSELLLVLDRPDIPLHNNMSESDIREYVKRRKISGSTRSDSGRKARDTFTSLKKTCRKLGVSFWNYLEDRVSHRYNIPPLADILKLKIK